MRLEQLNYIVEIARRRSLSNTAEKLHISQSALSVAVKQLEMELGRILFKRTSKGLFLTTDGEKIYHEIIEVLHTIRGWYANSPEENLKGEIHIICPPFISQYLTSTIIVPFRRQYPEVTIFIHSAQVQEITKKLKTTKASIALAAFSDPRELLAHAQARNWRIQHLFSDERRIFLGATHPLAQKKHLRIKELKNLHLAYYSGNSDQVSKNFEPYFASTYRLANRDDILELVVRNEAVFITSSYFFKDDYRIKDHMIISRPIPVPDIHIKSEIFALCLPEMSAVETAFWEYLLQNFAIDGASA